MEWTEDDLTMVERLGKALMPLRDVATIFDLADDECDPDIEDNQEWLQRYAKGKLMSKMELHEAIVKSATDGSSPAQTLAKDLLNKTNEDELG